MQLCCLPPGCPIIVLFSLLAAIFKQIQKAGVAEKYVSANFMKIDVNRGKIQIHAPTEGQPVLGSRLFAKCHSSAGRLIPQHKAREPAAALLPAGDGVRGTAERGGEELLWFEDGTEGVCGTGIRLRQLRCSPTTSTGLRCIIVEGSDTL